MYSILFKNYRLASNVKNNFPEKSIFFWNVRFNTNSDLQTLTVSRKYIAIVKFKNRNNVLPNTHVSVRSLVRQQTVSDDLRSVH